MQDGTFNTAHLNTADIQIHADSKTFTKQYEDLDALTCVLWPEWHDKSQSRDVHCCRRHRKCMPLVK
jgi:hypothetical protein